MNDQMLFGYHMDAYFDRMLQDLEQLIAIPSVCASPSAEGPFGRECAKALDCILNIARRLGLETANADGYAGHAAYGDGDACIDILTHVDVVPAGEGWSFDPFLAVQKGRLLYGRGTADDKGPAIAALYALKALKDAGVKGNYRLRAVFGCGEEIGSEDLDIYYARFGFPVMGFTPDCSYGICSSEKGILRVRFLASSVKKSPVQSLAAGTAVNSVPASAQAVLRCTSAQADKLWGLVDGSSDFHLEAKEEGLSITAVGKAAHGAEPQLGINAASRLVQLLSQALLPEELGPLFTFAAEKIGMEFDGSSLGICLSDEPSGPLTLNLGLADAKNGQEALSVDIRYPVTANKNFILSRLRDAAAPYGVKVEEIQHTAPLHIPKDAPLISALCAAYTAATQKPCPIYSTGGGTYARHCPNTVAAFGPIFPEETGSQAHGPDEHIDLDYFRLHCRVCAEALYRLFTS